MDPCIARWLDWIGQAVSISEEKVANSNRFGHAFPLLCFIPSPSISRGGLVYGCCITDYDGQGQHLFMICTLPCAKPKSHHCPCPQSSYISKFHKIMRLMAVKGPGKTRKPSPYLSPCTHGGYPVDRRKNVHVWLLARYMCACGLVRASLVHNNWAILFPNPKPSY